MTLLRVAKATTQDLRTDIGYRRVDIRRACAQFDDALLCLGLPWSSDFEVSCRESGFMRIGRRSFWLELNSTRSAQRPLLLLPCPGVLGTARRCHLPQRSALAPSVLSFFSSPFAHPSKIPRITHACHGIAARDSLGGRCIQQSNAEVDPHPSPLISAAMCVRT